MNSSWGRNIVTQTLAADRPGNVEFAAGLLRAGNLVAMPTETVYGLAANALNAKAVNRIFKAKQRPYWDPLIVHVADADMLSRVAGNLPPTARTLMAAFWPGPLTLLLPRRGRLPMLVTAGRELVAVRMPAHPVALHLIRAARVPLAAPSANLFGHVSPTTAAHVLADLRGRLHAVLDAGPCAVGVESTVLDPAAMVLYRQGGISAADIERVTGAPVTIYQAESSLSREPESLPSPGTAVRHYAPRARLQLVSSQNELQQTLAKADRATTGVMLPSDWSQAQWSGKTFGWGRWDDPAELARTLYVGLRALEEEGVATIVCPLPASSSMAMVEAVRDRLLKAARSA